MRHDRGSSRGSTGIYGEACAEVHGAVGPPKRRRHERRRDKLKFAPRLALGGYLRYLIIALLASSMSYASHETGFLNRAVKVNGTLYRYQVYLPADWTKSKQWPVILFLHGAGERGD